MLISVDTSDLEHFVTSNLFYDTVETVEDVGIVPTMDISVEVDENYIANGFVVHNSALSAALGSHNRRVLVATTHLSLQKQYIEYDFFPLYGRSNYECIESPMGNTTDQCLYPKMKDCPVVAQCRYIVAKNNWIASDRSSLNYAYFLNASWLKDYQRDWIVLDEAHEIPRYLMDYLTVDFSAKDCAKHDVPFWKPRKEVSSQAIAMLRARDWLHMAVTNVEDDIAKFERLVAAGEMHLVSKLRNLYQLYTKLNNAKIGISTNPDEWFAYLSEDRIKIAPLSAKDFFRTFFVDGFHGQFLLMSATVGNPESFAESIGIDSFAQREVPSRFPPESRPIHDLGAPRMSYGTSPLAYEKQADLVANAIKNVPDDWSGILHVQSRAKAKALGERLARRGLQDRLYLVQGKGTMAKIDNWSRQKARIPNSLAISYSFHQGVDLMQERINISCDIPFASLADPIERARANRYGDFYRHNAAILLEQRNGRTRRGRPEDYDTKDEIAGYNAVADGNLRLVESHLSADFRSCLQAA